MRDFHTGSTESSHSTRALSHSVQRALSPLYTLPDVFARTSETMKV